MPVFPLRLVLVRRLGSVLAFAGLAAFGSSCNLDPVHKSAVNDLQGERDDLYPPESEYHRPGEPCALCHSDKGPAKTKFVLGGTVFWGPDDYNARVDNAYVRVLDANKDRRCFVTNCNGNFYVRDVDFTNLTFPLLISVERTNAPGKGDENTLVIRRMSSHIGREASCANCHVQGLRDYLSPGQIRMFDSADQFTAKKIPLIACPPPPDYTVVAQCPEDR
jgi:hypothetical protein